MSLFENVILFKNRILIPQKLLGDVLNSTHNGIVAMKEEARGCIWWPNMNSDIENVTKLCVVFFANVKANKESILSWPTPSKPWSCFHIGFCGPVEKKFLLMIIDAFSKFLDLHVTNNIVIGKLRNTFSNFGIPDVIVSDNA